MPITFHCPQGHRLTCPDELAGKPGKCPKCGVVVRIPSPTTALAAPPLNEAGPDADEAPSTLQSAADGVSQSDLGLDQIIFLCPNGHRLHGSSSLAGRPGQCPHCGVKFLVPSPDDDDDDEEPAVEEQPADDALDEIVIQIDTSGKGGSSKGGSSKAGRVSSASNPSLPPTGHSLASVLAQAWRLKAQGASIEVHLGNGTLIEPDQFSAKDGQCALFSLREADGSHTLTIVAWSSIERVVVRGLEQLPREWF